MVLQRAVVRAVVGAVVGAATGAVAGPTMTKAGAGLMAGAGGWRAVAADQALRGTRETRTIASITYAIAGACSALGR